MAAKPVFPTLEVEETNVAMELQPNHPLSQGEGSVVANGGAFETTPSAVLRPEASGSMQSALTAPRQADSASGDERGSTGKPSRMNGNSGLDLSRPRTLDSETGWGDERLQLSMTL